jgi:GxxExxY protein
MARPTDKGRGDRRTYAVIGAAMKVHGRLGCGFLESAYHSALAKEFNALGIPYEREVVLPVFYEGERLDVVYRADFVCYNSVIVELKAQTRLGKVDEAQLLNYLRATGYEVGLLLNFGAASLQFKRYVCSRGSRR